MELAAYVDALLLGFRKCEILIPCPHLVLDEQWDELVNEVICCC